ncbi:MAG: hypothetical protein ACKV2T_35790 [Kofleriaceae bacterium]
MRLSPIGSESRVSGLFLVGLVGLVVIASASRANHPTITSHATRQPMLVEPAGGSILWGFTAQPRVAIALDGRTHRITHVGGYGELIEITSSHRCAKADLEVVRIAPGPSRIIHRDAEPSSTAYVPDGTYELTVTCDGARSRATRLAVSPR